MLENITYSAVSPWTWSWNR